jgi:hypothetical protein
MQLCSDHAVRRKLCVVSRGLLDTSSAVYLTGVFCGKLDNVTQ